MSRPIQGDDSERAGLRFGKWAWTLGSVNRPALCGGFILAACETVGVQVEMHRCRGLRAGPAPGRAGHPRRLGGRSGCPRTAATGSPAPAPGPGQGRAAAPAARRRPARPARPRRGRGRTEPARRGCGGPDVASTSRKPLWPSPDLSATAPPRGNPTPASPPGQHSLAPIVHLLVSTTRLASASYSLSGVWLCWIMSAIGWRCSRLIRPTAARHRSRVGFLLFRIP